VKIETALKVADGLSSMNCLLAWIEKDPEENTLTYYEGQHVLGGTLLNEALTRDSDQEEVEEMGLDPDIFPLIAPIKGNVIVACTRL
jgi:hypothetical protein